VDAGGVLTWGCNLLGQCGHGGSPSEVASPRLLAPLLGVPIKAVRAGLNHTLALSEAGDVYAWGANESGQLGLGHTQHVVRPELMEAAALEQVVQVSAGTRCELFMNADLQDALECLCLHVLACLYCSACARLLAQGWHSCCADCFSGGRST
jgi:alpha-tubulin suppressor-like RCC1 family protein